LIKVLMQSVEALEAKDMAIAATGTKAYEASLQALD
jgi:hypothetical protein